jgi:hypothetical protein
LKNLSTEESHLNDDDWNHLPEGKSKTLKDSNESDGTNAIEDHKPSQGTVAVDYNQTLAQVYNQFAHAVISNRKDMSIVFHVEGTYPQPRRNDLVSWAPDWTLHKFQHINPISDPPFVLTKGATLSAAESNLWIQNKSVMGVVGWKLSHIKEINEIINWHDNSLPRTSTQVLFTRRECKLVYEQWLDRLGRQLLSPLPQQWEEGYLCSSWALSEDFEDFSFAERDFAIQLFTYSGRKRMTSLVGGRWVARLYDGRNVIVPASAEKGNTIFEINTGHKPVVLRDFVCTDKAPIDDELRAKFANVFTKEWGRGHIACSRVDLVRSDIEKVGGLSIGHYQVIGECFVDTVKGHQWSEVQGPISRWEIVALH